MKINPVVIHDVENKRVEGEPEPADEMGEENDSLMGLRSRDNLSRRWKTVADFLGQISGRLQLFNILLLDGGGHPLASCSGSGHFWRTFVGGEDEFLGSRARAKGKGRAEVEEGVGRKEEAFPLYKGNETLCLPACLTEPARSPLTVIDGTVRLPTLVLKSERIDMVD